MLPADSRVVDKWGELHARFLNRLKGVAAPPMGGERERRLGETPTAFGVLVGIDLGVLKVLDAAGARELIDVGGDP